MGVKSSCNVNLLWIPGAYNITFAIFDHMSFVFESPPVVKHISGTSTIFIIQFARFISHETSFPLRRLILRGYIWLWINTYHVWGRNIHKSRRVWWYPKMEDPQTMAARTSPNLDDLGYLMVIIITFPILGNLQRLQVKKKKKKKTTTSSDSTKTSSTKKKRKEVNLGSQQCQQVSEMSF